MLIAIFQAFAVGNCMRLISENCSLNTIIQPIEVNATLIGLRWRDVATIHLEIGCGG